MIIHRVVWIILGVCLIFCTFYMSAPIVKKELIDYIAVGNKPSCKELIFAAAAVKKFPNYKKDMNVKILCLVRDRINKLNLVIQSLKNVVNIVSQEEDGQLPMISIVKNLIFDFVSKVTKLRGAEQNLLAVLKPDVIVDVCNKSY